MVTSDSTLQQVDSFSEPPLCDFDSPFGPFLGQKQQGERVAREYFPSLLHAVLQLCRFDNNFVPKDLDLQCEEEMTNGNDNVSPDEKARRQINQRDAARAVTNNLLNKNLEGKMQNRKAASACSNCGCMTKCEFNEHRYKCMNIGYQFASV